jgi:predicted permease
MRNLTRELRFAARRLARRPLLSVIAIATLAVGIGVNTAVFSLLEAVVLRPLPLPDAERLVYVGELDPNGGTSRMGFTTYLDLGARIESFASLAAASNRMPIAAGEEGAETLAALAVSASWLPTLGVPPQLGRNFTAEEDLPGAPRVVLVGNAYWRRRLGADASIVGGTVRLNDIPHTVVGVLPPELDRLLGPGERNRLDLITPLRYGVDLSNACRGCRHLEIFGRLDPATAPERARAELDAALAELRAAHPDDYPTSRGALTPMRSRLAAGSRPLLLPLAAGVSLVLLLAVANVAALLAARALERERELAIQRSLGAGRQDLLLSAWSEAAWLAAAGGVAGLAVAGPALRALVALAPPDLSRFDAPELSVPLLAFAVAASLLATLLAGVAPALVHARSSARGLLAATFAAGPGRRRGRGFGRLVVAELALAIVVVFAAGLVGRSLESLLAEETGFQPDQVTVADVQVVGAGYPDDAAVHAFFAAAADRLAALPGVEAIGFVSQLPLGGNFDTYSLRFADRPEMRLEELPSGDRYAVTPGYFRALGLRLVAGRFLSAADRADGEPVLMISRRLAETIWPGESVVGKRVRMGGDEAPWRTVVGVVEDVRHRGLDRPSAAQFYVPDQQWLFADAGRALVVRSSLPAAAVAAQIAPALHELDAGAAVERVRSMSSVVEASTGGRRYAAGVWSSFAAMALALASLGTYGLLARQVTLRRRELGVRSALGAAPRDLVAEIAGRTARLLVFGIVLATPLCLAAGRLLGSQLWRVPAADPVSLGAAVAALALGAAAAAVVPARRAAAVDPAVVLRDE